MFIAGCRLRWRLKALNTPMGIAVLTAVTSLAAGEICAKLESTQQQAAARWALVPYSTFVAYRGILDTAT